MTLPFATLLALRQLQHQGLGLVGKFAGVCVAIVLVFIQIGFQNALLSSVLNLDRALVGEIVIAGPQFETIGYSPPWFPRELLYQARGVPGVASVTGAQIFASQIRDPEHGSPVIARFIGIDLVDPILDLPELGPLLSQLALPNTAAIDSRSRQRLLTVTERLAVGEAPLTLYLQSPGSTLAPRVDLIGTFTLGPDFALAGNVVTSDLNFYRFFKYPPDRVSLGAVRVAANEDSVVVRDRVAERLGAAAQVSLRSDFIARERDYFNHQTPIGVLFSFGISIGVLIGVVFVFEVLRGMIDANVSEYAVLRAMGYQDGFFVALVLQIGGLVALLAFIPSVAVTAALYRALAHATQLDFSLTWLVTLAVFAATVVMCACAVLFAVRKLRKSDPIDLFS